ncbi:MAG: hypothetical protein B7Y43_02710 [Sphingomonas sp. 28-62-20]|uniref:hypothetical protein n=1 Tax=Sphingomonas sp. 28-62-20 TaxID=1970433 RepID=UPI000BCB1F62|nr:MAG: hypothetical protein B7Y43_02710 [Sphingomonas sp. 28-62-20]
MNVLVYLAILVVSCLYAGMRGGPPERLAALTLVAAIIASVFAPASNAIRFQGIEYGIMAVDTACLVAVVAIAIHAQRYWPMWMAAILLDIVLTHALMLTPSLMPWSYSVMIAAWNYPIPIILAIGTWRHRARLQTYGSDAAWNR